MTEPKLFIATKAFIEHDGKILILRESGTYQDGANPGRYDLPGGRLKAGEHFLVALAREIKEETGLTVEIGKPFCVNEWRPTVKGEPWHIVGVFFHCTTKEKNVNKGVFITTSRFPRKAEEDASRSRKNIILIDGQKLVQHMFDYDVGVSQIRTYVIKKVDIDFFVDE